MPHFFDSHCHLDFAAFDPDREQVWQRAKRAGVVGVLLPGVHPEQWFGSAQLRAQHPEWYTSVGLHPYWLHRLSSQVLERSLAELAQSAQALGACAIGECGLDARLPKLGGFSLSEQRRVLLPQLQVARELELPLVLHIVRAHGPALELLEELGPFRAGGVLHGYSGPAELVPRYAALGFSFAFGGAITRPNARRARQALLAVPDERLLLETDAPDQAPHTGPDAPHIERNEPAALLEIARLVTLVRGQVGGLSRLGALTCDNAKRLFGAHVSVSQS